MRPHPAISAAVVCGGVAVALAGCGSSPRAWIQPTVRTQARASVKPRYALALHWSGISIANQTGFYVYLNGVQRATVAASPYTFSKLACGTTYTAGVRAHDGAEKTSGLHSATYTTATCPARTTNCFVSPGTCGYPDPVPADDGGTANVGVPEGTTLTRSGPLVITTPGTVISGLNISGSTSPLVEIRANNVTIEDSRIMMTGTGCGTQITCGNADVQISEDGGSGYTGIHLTHDELTADGATVEYAMRNDQGCPGAAGGLATAQDCLEADHLYIHNVDGGLWTYGGGYLHDNYVRSQRLIVSDHLEDIYCAGNETNSLYVSHDTQFNTNNSVAPGVFCDTNGGAGGMCSSHITMIDSLLAGGGFAIYECGNASSQGSATLDFVNNDIARCTTGRITRATDGGHDCQGLIGTAPGTGADSHGYWPYGGHYGIDSYTYCAAGTNWSGNVWDDNGATIACQ